ncbi:MAG: 4Fe-4S dicluster domain-containing protein [Myxococcota bacterium]
MPELDRRNFLKLVGAGAGAAATVGCDPVEKLVPYVIQPEEITPGIPVVYASTCTECPSQCGMHVKTREGRPIKLEGNPNDELHVGALCARGYASLARTYHPDRYTGPRRRGGDGLEPATWDEAISALTDRVNALRQKGQVDRLRVFGGDRGPALGSVIDGFIRAIGGDPASQRLVDEPFADRALRKATQAVFGASGAPVFDLSGADLVLDFGSDFLDTGASSTAHSAQFAAAQDLAKHADGGARLVSIGPRMDLTVSNSDQWLPAAAGHEGRVALALARLVADAKGGASGAAAGVLGGVDPAAIAAAAGLELADLQALAAKIAGSKAVVALPPGVAARTRRAVADAASVLLLNAVAGAVGTTLRIPAEGGGTEPASLTRIQQLIADMKAGRVDVLLIHDANPVYSLPAELGFAEALSQVGLVVSTASMANETSELAGWVLPDHAPLESWGDAAPRPGVHLVVQPTIRPLYDTQALGDLLLTVGRKVGDDVGSQLPSGSFRGVVQQAFGGDWRKILADGGVFGAEPASVDGAVAASVASLEFGAPDVEGSGDFTLVAYPHSFMGDGGGAALPWTQETPHPVTKASWVSWAEISTATAEALGVTFGDMLKVETGFGAGSIELPAYPRGGVRDDVVAIAIGQGHTVGYYASLAGDGQPGEARGANVVSVLPAATDESGGRAWLSTRAVVHPTGGFKRIPLSQWTDNQRERGIAPAVSLAALAAGGDHGEHASDDGHHGGGNVAREHFAHEEAGLVSPYDPSNDARPDSPYRWGMVVDNDRCNGCSACVVACAGENNISIVGEANAIRHRELTWIRIERYVGDGDRTGGAERRGWPNREKLGEVDVRHAPMLCQHCGAAPCESVCPVIATYHTPEGLNGMVYNRCVGTRYCANNCVYKVRRFNYFDYGHDNYPGLLSLALNPDVTVRGQGVMEKCTFCVQRIEAARQPAKDEGRDIGDGEVVTACQQACPTSAITFGNTRDPQSAVVKKASDEARSYHSLIQLNARPAITYLAQVNREADGESHG